MSKEDTVLIQCCIARLDAVSSTLLSTSLPTLRYPVNETICDLRRLLKRANQYIADDPVEIREIGEVK